MNIFFSPRLIAILKMLAEKKDYVPTAFLAEALEISTRTVYREMEDIDKILAPFGISIEAKSGLGYKILGNETSATRFFDILNASGELIPWSNAEERRNLLLIELLQASDTIKLINLSHILSVSEGTISRDLDVIEEFLANYDLEILRKPGIGVEILGEEEAIRKAIAELVYDRLILDTSSGHDSKENLHKYFKDQDTGILSLLNKEDLNNVIDVLGNSSLNIMSRITEHSMIGLVIHLTVAISRIRNGEEIALDKTVLDWC